MALLRHVARQQEHIQAIRNSPEPRGAYHNADSTATDVRPGIHQPLIPMYEELRLPRDAPTREEATTRMAAARARLPRTAGRAPAIQPRNIPGFPSETWAQRQRRLAREQGVTQPKPPMRTVTQPAAPRY